MSRVNILATFDIHSLEDVYYIVGSADTGSFTHKLGTGEELYHPRPPSDWKGVNPTTSATVNCPVPLGEDYGNFKIRLYAENDLGIRSPYVELDKLIPAPDIDGTFSFRNIAVRNLKQSKPSAEQEILQHASKDDNELHALTEFLGQSFTLDWELGAAPTLSGNSKGTVYSDNPYLSHFEISFYATQADLDSSTESTGTLLPDPMSIPPSWETTGAYSAGQLEKYTNFGISLSKKNIYDLYTHNSIVRDASNNDFRALYMEIRGRDFFHKTALDVDKPNHTFVAKIKLDNIKAELDKCFAELFGKKMNVSYVSKDPDVPIGAVKVFQYEASSPDATFSVADWTATAAPPSVINRTTAVLDQEWSSDTNKHLYRYVIELSDGYGVCGYHAITDKGKLHDTLYNTPEEALEFAGEWESYVSITNLRIIESGVVEGVDRGAFKVAWDVEDSSGNKIDIQKVNNDSVLFQLNGEPLMNIRGFSAQLECPIDYTAANANFEPRDAFDLEILEDDAYGPLAGGSPRRSYLKQRPSTPTTDSLLILPRGLPCCGPKTKTYTEAGLTKTTRRTEGAAEGMSLITTLRPTALIKTP